MNWTPDQLPDLTGKTYVVTGGNSGIGLEACKILGSKGATVVFTARSEEKAEGAIATMREASPSGTFDYVLLDLSDQASVAAGAQAILDKAPALHAVINNAGVMQPPLRRTAEGWELQFATNHLGHAKLDSLLFERLEANGGRIVPVSSVAHKSGTIDFDDLMSEASYSPTIRYCQSKLANLMYGFELDRRLQARGSSVVSIPCHPGYAATNLQTAGVSMEGGSGLFRNLYKITNALIAQPAERGAYPLCLSAAWPEAQRGTYYGPTAFGDARGKVGKSSVAKRARDEAVAARLWDVTEDLVGPFFPA